MGEDISSIIHPLILLPLIGQILLVITLFQKNPKRLFIYLGAGTIGLLIVMVLLAGIMGRNFNILISTIPFLLIAGILVRTLKN